MFDYNLKIIEKNPMHWVGEFKEESNIEIIDLNTILNKTSNRIFKLNGNFDESVSLNKDFKKLYFVFGIYSIKEIEKFLSEINPASYVIFIEPNQTFLSATLNYKKMDFLNNYKNLLFCDSEDEFSEFVQGCFGIIDILGLVKTYDIYLTEYYRSNNLDQVKRIVKIINDVIRDLVFSIGNSIYDGLDGLKNNLLNLDKLVLSKDVAKLKNTHLDKPAVIVSAGPSLDKNLHLLKGKEDELLIIVVDTVLKKVLSMGIKPHYVCTVERLEIVYDYFYDNIELPENLKFVGPPLVDPRILNKFGENVILPFRHEVAEYRWFKKIIDYEDNNNITMGLSCAHVAFGYAMHVGASPIILIGQDLAYNEIGDSHSTSTIYDKDSKISIEEEEIGKDIVEGYYGGTVTTNEIWKSFKFWFEREIKHKNLNVIDATEGGAKIKYTKIQPLNEVLNDFKNLNHNHEQEINKIAEYPINYNKVKQNLLDEKNNMIAFMKDIEKIVPKLSDITVLNKITQKKLINSIDLFQQSDRMVVATFSNAILSHNLQSILLKALWDINALPQNFSIEVIKSKANIHLKVLLSIISCILEVTNYIDNALGNIEDR